MASFLVFVPRPGKELTVDAMRNAFEAAGVSCAAEVTDVGDRGTLVFEPTFNLVYLTLDGGLVRRAELRPDYRRTDRMGDKIINHLHDLAYEHRDEDEWD